MPDRDHVIPDFQGAVDAVSSAFGIEPDGVIKQHFVSPNVNEQGWEPPEIGIVW